jgi:predicted metal-dependent HD superfamily phosphohydrolase
MPTRFADAPLAIPPACGAAVIAAWSMPPRAYHDLAHLDGVLAEFHAAAARAAWQRPREVYWALCCHDAIYVAGARDNEARSADLADRLAEVHLAPELDRDRVRGLILATAVYGAIAGAALDADTARMLDCDLAILGAPPERFDAYDAAIAVEYAHLPAAGFRAGRREFLTRLLAAPRIFCSDDGHARLDAAARSNLSRAVARLMT